MKYIYIFIIICIILFYIKLQSNKFTEGVYKNRYAKGNLEGVYKNLSDSKLVFENFENSGIFKDKNKVDCKLSNWSNCVNGIQTRNIIQQPKNGGKSCGNLKQNCNIDCVINFDSGKKLNHETIEYTGNITKQAMNGGKPCGNTIDNIGYISKIVFDENNDCVINYDYENLITINNDAIAVNGKIVSGNCKSNPYKIIAITKNKAQDVLRCKKNLQVNKQNTIGSCINGLQKVIGVYGFSEDKTCPVAGTQETLYFPCEK